MQCSKCLAVTSNKMKKTCPNPRCGGRLVKQKDARPFSVMNSYRKRKTT